MLTILFDDSVLNDNLKAYFSNDPLGATVADHLDHWAKMVFSTKRIDDGGTPLAGTEVQCQNVLADCENSGVTCLEMILIKLLHYAGICLGHLSSEVMRDKLGEFPFEIIHVETGRVVADFP